MKKSALIFFVFFLVIICISCNSVPKKEKPLWADTFSINQVFPSEKYITALGYANTEEMSMIMADGNLASYFSKEISSIVKANQMLSNMEEEKERLSREITIKSQIKLLGIKHTNCFFDANNKTYVVCSYISREEIWSVLEPKLNLFYSSISKPLTQIKKQRGLKVLINANKVLSNTSEFKEMYYTALFVFPSRCEKYTNLMEELMLLKQQKQIKKREVKIKINIKGDVNDRIYSKISSLVSEAGFTICMSGENHIMNVNVDIENHIIGNVHSIYPQIFVEISDGKEVISTFSKSLEKLSAYNPATVQKMALSRIEDVLEQEFVAVCLK